MSEKMLAVLLKFCLVVDLDAYAAVIKQLEETLWKFSDDPVLRKVDFISSYAARTKSDYDSLLMDSLGQTTIEDEEVAARLESFQDNLERTAASQSETSGASSGE